MWVSRRFFLQSRRRCRFSCSKSRLDFWGFCKRFWVQLSRGRGNEFLSRFLACVTPLTTSRPIAHKRKCVLWQAAKKHIFRSCSLSPYRRYVPKKGDQIFKAHRCPLVFGFRCVLPFTGETQSYVSILLLCEPTQPTSRLTSFLRFDYVDIQFLHNALHLQWAK